MYRYFDNKHKKIHIPYLRHCALSLYFAHRMFICSIKSLVHGFIPLFFKKSIAIRARNIPSQLRKIMPDNFQGSITISSPDNNTIITATLK